MIQFGIDVLLSNPPAWKGQRIGLLTNDAAATNDQVPSRKALLKNGFNLQKLFSPEHGLSVKGTDGHLMRDGTDELTQLPVISLYSEKLSPSEQDLADIDIVLFDIPDVGSRFYTYLWTMTYMLEACAKYQKKFIILDRPNPVSGKMELAEGPTLDTAQASFIGRWPIPVRHSCTLGELALYFQKNRSINCDIDIIKCNNWQREMFQPDWDTTFVATSPAIRNFQSMLLYPGLCLLEATNISEGRSTEHSFTSATAPWMNGKQVANIINDMGLELRCYSTSYTPAEAPYAGKLCHGVRFEVTEPEHFQPVFFGMLLLKLIKQLYPSQFEWAPYSTLVNPTGNQHLDKLLGISNSEVLFDLPLQKFIAEAKKFTDARKWKEEIKMALLY